MRAAWLGVVAMWGCYVTKETPCGDRLCPSVLVCSPDQTCVSQQQLAACDTLPDGSLCNYNNLQGFCHHQTCVTSLDTCGDGVTSPALGELCDCGDPSLLLAPPVGCQGFNSDEPGATCRAGCKPARCGDGILDPGEQCDDGNTVSGDGCRGDCQGRFAKMQTPTGDGLNAVWTRGPSEAYAVGDAGTVLRFDGTSWTQVDAGVTFGLSQVWSSGPSDVYLVGGRTLVHFDGSSWVQSAFSQTILGIWGTASSDVYVFGVAGLFEHFDGSAWTAVALPAECDPTGGIVAVFGSGADLFAGGTAGICVRHAGTWTHLDNGASYALTGDQTTVYSFDAFYTETMRVVTGSGVVAMQVPGMMLRAVVTGPGELLAAGYGGTVLRLDRVAGTWTHLVSTTEQTLAGLSASSPTNVFVVGGFGTVLH